MPSGTSSTAVIHSVHFYDRDEALIQRLRGVVLSSLDAGNSILTIATEEHRRQLIEALGFATPELRTLRKDGRFNCCDAREMLTEIMIDGMPDRDRFVLLVGTRVSTAKRAAWSAHRGLTVFGEMVTALWEAGNRMGALKLEGLWNDLLNKHSFHLHCAYPRHILAASKDPKSIKAICDGHSHLIGQPV